MLLTRRRVLALIGLCAIALCIVAYGAYTVFQHRNSPAPPSAPPAQTQVAAQQPSACDRLFSDYQSQGGPELRVTTAYASAFSFASDQSGFVNSLEGSNGVRVDVRILYYGQMDATAGFASYNYRGLALWFWDNGAATIYRCQ